MRPHIYHFLLMATLLMATLLLMVGCGGGSHVVNDSSATGRATFTVVWPKPSRLIPAAANSIVVQIIKASTVIATQTLARPASGGTATANFTVLPTGSFTATATAYPNADGTGVAQALASTPLTIQANQNTPFTLTMASTIDHLAITPPSLTLNIGQNSTLMVTAYDSQGNIVLISPSKLQWVSSNTSAATVDGTGDVTGMSVGSTQIMVTDTESQKSASTTISVNPGSVHVTTLNLDTWDLKYDAGRQLVYATTSASAPLYPNSVVPINPATATLGTPIPLDNTPRFLTLSGDGNHLYVGGDNGTVKRLAMPGGTLEATIPLPSGMTPVWMLTLPNTPDTWIIALQSTSGAANQALVYDGTTPRANTATMGEFITINAAGTRLYGIERFQTSGNLYYSASIGSSGLTNATSQVTAMQGYGVRIQWVNGEMLADNGVIANPDSGQTLGQLTFTTVDHVIGAVPGSNRVYFAAWDPKQLQTYDLPGPTATNTIPLGNLSGGLETATWCGTNRMIVRSFSGAPNTVTIISDLP